MLPNASTGWFVLYCQSIFWFLKLPPFWNHLSFCLAFLHFSFLWISAIGLQPSIGIWSRPVSCFYYNSEDEHSFSFKVPVTFIHSFLHSLNMPFLSAYYVPKSSRGLCLVGIMPGTLWVFYKYLLKERKLLRLELRVSESLTDFFSQHSEKSSCL